MKKFVHHTLIAACLGGIIATPSFAYAPVVDESENFALFDEQLAVAEPQPGALIEDETASTNELVDEGVALAHEEVAIDTNTQDPGSLFNRVQSLQQELNELRGQLEIQTHALQNLKQQQLDFYKDLDTRVRENTTTASDTHAQNTQEAPTSLPESTAPRGNPANEQIRYLAAYELVKNNEFDKAIMAMKSFIEQYPRGGYTANAHYWLGELYMTQKAYPDAIQQFKTVLNLFPSSSKLSASSLKLGYALAASGDVSSARERLKSVIRDYPNTQAAKLAASKLETLRS